MGSVGAWLHVGVGLPPARRDRPDASSAGLEKGRLFLERAGPRSYYHGPTVIELARMHTSTRKFADAATAIAAAGALVHNPADLLMAKGALLLAQGHPAEAMETLEQAFHLAMDSSNGLLRIKAARLLAKACEQAENVGRADQYLNLAFKEAKRRRLPVIARAIRADMARLDIHESAIVTDKPLLLDDDTDVPGYILGRKLGSGGFGSVFRAYDSDRHELVAIKKISLSSIYNSADRAMLQRSLVTELEAASRINHPGCVNVHALGETAEADLFIVQDYIEGLPLDKCFGPDAALRQKTDLLIKVASALEALHTAGVVHRDLKPENILVKPNGDPVLIDFGIAVLSEQSDAFAGVGSIHYMAPEQMSGKTVDYRADWFSFGVIAVELLTGIRPVTVTTKNGKQTRQVQRRKDIILPNGATRSLQTTLSSLLSPRARSRPHDAALIIQALKAG